jgi:hypothetical protein
MSQPIDVDKIKRLPAEEAVDLLAQVLEEVQKELKTYDYRLSELED